MGSRLCAPLVRRRYLSLSEGRTPRQSVCGALAPSPLVRRCYFSLLSPLKDQDSSGRGAPLKGQGALAGVLPCLMSISCGV